MPNSRRIAGLRVHHASRLPHVQIQNYQPHGRLPRGSVARHPRDSFGFLHGCVRLQEDARPVIGAGLGSVRGGPRPGDEHHARAWRLGRQARRDARHLQAGERRGRQARPRGTQVWGGGPQLSARGRQSPTCAWPTARSATRRSPDASSAGRAPQRPWDAVHQPRVHH